MSTDCYCCRDSFECQKGHGMADNEFAGYHKFKNDAGEEYGSFEVFHADKDYIRVVNTTCEEMEVNPVFFGEGWYWWACSPGCLPDGEASGPFPTAEGAYLDALEG